MSDHIGISYAREDSDARELLKLKLEARGFKVLDDSMLPLGEQWASYLADRIRESKAVIVIWTKAASESHYVTAEYAFAIGCRVPVIPIIWDGTPLSEILRNRAGLDFSRDRDWERLFVALGT